jgi:hypothetical protein
MPGIQRHRPEQGEECVPHGIVRIRNKSRQKQFDKRQETGLEVTNTKRL